MIAQVNQNNNIKIDSFSATQKMFQQQLFDFRVTLNNHVLPIYTLPSNLILELVIEDQLLEWPFKGYITYKNISEGLERSKQNPNANTDGSGSDPLYYYRMDARDELSIYIKPVSEEIELPDKIWTIKLDLVVYDTEDLKSSNIHEKAKRLYFWDKRYQILLEKKIQFSTATSQNLKNPSLATDEERSMYSGMAIQQLLQTPSLNLANSINTENWDRGKSKIFYTAPAQYSAMDCLNDLLNKHISEKTGLESSDISLFTLSRQDDGSTKWELTPLTNYFKKAGINQPGDLQIEHLFFEDSPDENTTPYKAPILDEVSYNKDIKMTEYNKITTYEFVDMSGIDNAKTLVSKPVYWYDIKNKQFGFDFSKNEIQNVRTNFKELYTQHLYPKDGASPLFTLNKTKTDQYAIEPDFAYMNAAKFSDLNSRDKIGKLKTLFSGIFLNECISIRLLGSPHRISGTFIGIDRMYSSDNEFDKKLCGQWFVVAVKHIFQHDKYLNDIIAIKIHSFDDNSKWANKDIE